jgi:Sortilin, neurotensin receptor 3,/Sortilin, neurotensin receptor 3, C-terminal
MGVLWLVAYIYVAIGANEDRIEFKQLEVDSPVQEVVYCGTKKDTILIITQERLVYRSENAGYTWKPVLASSEPIKKIKKIIASPIDSKLIAFLGSEGTNWYSEDCGKNIKSLSYANPMEDFQFHPKIRNWCLAGSWTKCSDFEQGQCKKYRVLYLSKNLGSSWEPILDYVVQFSWGLQGLNPDIANNFPLERIYVTRNSNVGGNQKISGWNYNVDFLRSDDFFSTSELIIPHGNKFLLSDKFILVATAVENDPDEVQLYVSNAYSIETFYRTELPVKRIPEHSYTLLDSTEGSIFIHVNHYGTKSNYGSIYISDSSGRRFSISLLHNVRESTGYCDFDKVKGLEGIFISNIYDKEQLSSDTDKKNKNEKIKFQKSVITFDKGGEWKPLEAPERDVEGKRYPCEDDCFLHLHSVTSSYPSVYSNVNAIGIVMGVGNVGKYLSYKEDEISTFLSRDAGLTWVEVKKGVYIYEMGDHGAIIVMADSQKATDKIYYSWNEGLKWEYLQIDSEIEVENIIIEPTATSQKFLVYGEKNGKGVTVSLDFSSYHEPNCRNPQQPDTEESDYETWSPHTKDSKTCLMGHKVEYVRRKRLAECFNGEEFERTKFIENCECTEEDFECDLGYYRDYGECKKMDNYDFPPQVCDQYNYIDVITGYRRVAGNTCEGGVSSTLDPIKIKCTSSIGKTWYMISAALLAAMLIFILKKYGEKLKSFNFSWAKDKFDRSGFFTDLSKAPEGMDEEEEMTENKLDLTEEEEFDPRS